MALIVVGVDGSEGARSALEWAAAEARLRGARLRAVHAWHLPAAAYGSGGFVPPVGVTWEDDLEEAAKAALDAVLDAAAGDARRARRRAPRRRGVGRRSS